MTKSTPNYNQQLSKEIFSNYNFDRKKWGALDINDSTSKELNVTLLLELVQKLHFSEISKVVTHTFFKHS